MAPGGETTRRHVRAGRRVTLVSKPGILWRSSLQSRETRSKQDSNHHGNTDAPPVSATTTEYCESCVSWSDMMDASVARVSLTSSERRGMAGAVAATRKKFRSPNGWRTPRLSSRLSAVKRPLPFARPALSPLLKHPRVLHPSTMASAKKMPMLPGYSVNIDHINVRLHWCHHAESECFFWGPPLRSGGRFRLSARPLGRQRLSIHTCRHCGLTHPTLSHDVTVCLCWFRFVFFCPARAQKTSHAKKQTFNFKNGMAVISEGTAYVLFVHF
jgi:hypothetical protein